MLSEYEGHICIACDVCGVDCNTGIAPDDDLNYWMNRYGWSDRQRADGDFEYLCPSCATEDFRRCLSGEYD